MDPLAFNPILYWFIFLMLYIDSFTILLLPKSEMETSIPFSHLYIKVQGWKHGMIWDNLQSSLPIIYHIFSTLVMVSFRLLWDLNVCPSSPMLITRHIALFKISREVLVSFKLHAVQTVERSEIELVASAHIFRPNSYLNIIVTTQKWIVRINNWTWSLDKDEHKSTNSN